MSSGVKASWKENDKGWAQLRKTMQSLKDGKSYVKVGVLDDGGKGSERRDGGLSNAQIAAVHEFGTRDGRIPERSFIRSTMAEKKNEYIQMFRKLIKGVYENKMTPEKMLGIVGAQAANDIKKKITAGPPIPPPNAPSVAARKAKKGSGGAVRTLVDTGRMVASVTWSVVLSSVGKGK